MSWSEFFKNNFALIIASIGVFFYSYLLKKKKDSEDQVDRLNTELALNKAQLVVAEIKSKKDANHSAIKELKKQQQTIEKKIDIISNAKTVVAKMDEQELADFLTKELNK